MGGSFDRAGGPPCHRPLVRRLKDPRDRRRAPPAISCGGVGETTDGGATWRKIVEGIRADYTPPGLAHDPGSQDVHRIAGCPSGRDTIWMRHCVGNLHSGPVYPHFLDVTGDGGTLALGSTTGSAWTGENGGDSRECLGADLPPVSCVRFAR